MLIVPIVAFRYRKSIVKVSKRELLILLALSIVQIFLPNFLQNIGLEYTSASVASVLQSTTLVFTLILAFTFLGERASWRQIAGAVVAMIGVTLLSTGGNLYVIAGSQLLGNLLQVGVAASYGVSGIIGKVLLERLPPLLVVAYSFVFGSALLSVFSILFERNAWPSSVSVSVIVAMLLLSFLYCLGLVFWYTVLQRSGVFRLYALLFLMPVLAVIISILVLNENFTSLDVIFSGTILVGVGLTESERNRPALV
jgi:drug/metabolite transporter (DMT)-like permease